MGFERKPMSGSTLAYRKAAGLLSAPFGPLICPEGAVLDTHLICRCVTTG